MKVTYCKKCLMPSTKPYLTFDQEGICNACESSDKKGKNKNENPIDWDEREKEFNDLIDWVKGQNAPYYDAMVPVSGGKDSITQVHRLLNHTDELLIIIETQVGNYTGEDDIVRLEDDYKRL